MLPASPGLVSSNPPFSVSLCLQLFSRKFFQIEFAFIICWTHTYIAFWEGGYVVLYEFLSPFCFAVFTGFVPQVVTTNVSILRLGFMFQQDETKSASNQNVALRFANFTLFTLLPPHGAPSCSKL